MTILRSLATLGRTGSVGFRGGSRVAVEVTRGALPEQFGGETDLEGGF